MTRKQSINNLPPNWVLTSISEIAVIYSGGTPDRRYSLNPKKSPTDSSQVSWAFSCLYCAEGIGGLAISEL